MSGSKPLDGKVSVITGAAGAIGSRTASLLAARGASIVAVDRAGTDWNKFRTNLPEGVRITTIEADVCDENSVRDYVDRARKETGRIDIFFNNAGIEGPQASIPDYPADDFRKVIDVNVVGVFLGLKYVIPVMAEQGSGAIVNASSTAGLIGAPNVAGYIASKHAVLGLTRAAAVEWARAGIRVNSVHPGFIESRMLNSIFSKIGEGVRQTLIANVPAGRLGSPDDIAHLVGFLCSDESSYINGAAFVADGGYTSQ